MSHGEAGTTWIDISRPLRDGIPVWPGDRPFQCETRREGTMILSWFSTTCHVGTHIDAPLHMEGRGPTVAELGFEQLIGPAEVVKIARAPRRIGLGNLPPGWRPRAPRVLFSTGTQAVPLDHINRELAGFGIDLVDALARWGVVLVGIDTPSVDPFDSTAFEAHHALAAAGITWIEGLNLEAADPGLYELIALPMPLTGTEAAPVRAVLRRLNGAATPVEST